MVVSEESTAGKADATTAIADPAMPDILSSAVEPRIVGRYALFDEIAAGGMATIHLGRLVGSTGFSRTVAIKTLHPQFARDPEFVEMFLQEARLASRIQHPNVISTLDRTIDKGEAFLVMEYVAGESLAKLVRASLKKGQLVPSNVAVSILAGTLHGLHATHEATNENREPMDIVHRDVSPQNILVGLDGVARIFDFGVAKAAAMKSQATADGQMKGKLSYMSPEQLNSKTVDRRTDVFAAGVVAWECVAGRRLFSGSDPGEVLAKVLTLDIPSPRDAQPNVPQALSDAIMKSLARSPDERWQTARDFAIALESTGLIAPGHQVGQWVEEHATEALKERRLLVEQVERASMELEALHVAPGEVSAGAVLNNEESSADSKSMAGETSSAAKVAPNTAESPSKSVRERKFSEGTSTASAAAVSVAAATALAPRSGHRQLWSTLLVGLVAGVSIAGGVWYRQTATGNQGIVERPGQSSGSQRLALPRNTALPTAELYYGGEAAPDSVTESAKPDLQQEKPSAQDEEGTPETENPSLAPSPAGKAAPPVVQAKDLPQAPPQVTEESPPRRVRKARKGRRSRSRKAGSSKQRLARRAALAARRAATRNKTKASRKPPGVETSKEQKPGTPSPKDSENIKPGKKSDKSRKPNCKPPTYVDKLGIRRVKSHCM